MSEWIDFLVYGVQIVLIWLFLPRHSSQCTVPAIVDRDPDWPAAHPAAMRAIEQSRWFLNVFYAFTALCIGVLLAARLERLPEALAPAGTPSWETLRRAHGVLMVIGLLGYFACFFVWLRWLAANVPLAAQRRATLTPRRAGDYLPRSWRVVTETLTAAHIALWLMLPALGFGGGADYWGRFAFIAVLTLGFAVYGHLAPQRRAGYADRLFGDGYRRAELRVVCMMRIALLTTGAVGLGEAMGVDLARAAHLALQVMLCGMALAFLRLRPIRPSTGGAANGYAVVAGDRPSAA
jgi:hypothetical protein